MQAGEMSPPAEHSPASHVANLLRNVNTACSLRLLVK